MGIRDICPKRHTRDRYLFIKSFAVGTHISLNFNRSMSNFLKTLLEVSY
jgi:hypothetical protein